MRNSSTRMTGKERYTTAPHSAPDRGVTENMSAAGGTYRMKQCSAMDSAIAPSSHGLLQGGNCHMHARSVVTNVNVLLKGRPDR